MHGGPAFCRLRSVPWARCPSLEDGDARTTDGGSHRERGVCGWGEDDDCTGGVPQQWRCTPAAPVNGDSAFVLPPQLGSAYAKLMRAAELADIVRSRFHEYFDRPPFRVEYHPHPNQARAGFSVHDIQPIPNAIFMEAGDVFHNARCSLDHLTYALAREQAPHASEDDWFGVTFPVVPERTQWKDGRVKLLDLPSKERIKQLQPFNLDEAGQSFDAIVLRSMLWRLSQLDRTDRHRRLNLVFVAVGKMHDPPRLPPPFFARREGFEVGPITEGREIAWWSFDGGVPEELPPNVDPAKFLPFTMAFADAPQLPAPGQTQAIVDDLVGTMRLTLDAVANVLGMFTPCFAGGDPHPIP